MNLKTAFKDTCKQQDDVTMRKLSVGKNSLFFPQREGRREGEERAVGQISLKTAKISGAHDFLAI